MRKIPTIAFAFAILAAQGCGTTNTATQPVQCPAGQHPVGTSCAFDAVLITIGPPVMTVNVTGHGVDTNIPVTDTIICSPFTPSPASAAVNQTVQWFNNSGATVTLFQQYPINSGIAASPIVTIPAGQTSNGVYWSKVGTISYTDSNCSIRGHVFDQYLPGQSVPTFGLLITVAAH